ncbi:carbohydrate kinase [soil metagenome]
MTGKPVLSLGEILIDLIASDGSTSLESVSSLDVRPGGAPANASVAFARLGELSAFCGVVGTDSFGHRMVNALATEGVNVTALRQEAGANTSIAFAWKNLRGDGEFRILRMADVLLGPADVERAAIHNSAAIVVGSVSLTAEPSRSAVYLAVELARSAGVPVCFDANIRPSLWSDRSAMAEICGPVLQQADLIKLSLDDANALYGEHQNGSDVIDGFTSAFCKFIVVTDGARGTWFSFRKDGAMVAPLLVPSFDVNAVDPTGAGDAFTAALVSRLLANRWQALAEVDVRFASAAGALATTKRGAMASLPTASDVQAFLSNRF